MHINIPHKHTHTTPPPHTHTLSECQVCPGNNSAGQDTASQRSSGEHPVWYQRGLPAGPLHSTPARRHQVRTAHQQWRQRTAFEMAPHACEIVCGGWREEEMRGRRRGREEETGGRRRWERGGEREQGIVRNSLSSRRQHDDSTSI